MELSRLHIEVVVWWCDVMACCCGSLVSCLVTLMCCCGSLVLMPCYFDVAGTTMRLDIVLWCGVALLWCYRQVWCWCHVTLMCWCYDATWCSAMMWHCGVMVLWCYSQFWCHAMPLRFYDMLLGRCNVYYAVVTLLFHTVTCISELLWTCCVTTYTSTLMNHCVKMTLRWRMTTLLLTTFYILKSR